MQIIFLRLNGARNLKFSSLQLSLLIMTIFLAGAIIAWCARPLIDSHFYSNPSSSQEKNSEFNLSAIINRLGQLQANIDQLDNLSTRLGNALGVKLERKKNEQPENYAPTLPASLEQSQLVPVIDTMLKHVSFQQTAFGQLENALSKKQLQALSWPTQMPVLDAANTSGFGWRNDPITGARTFHEGIDLAAPEGSAIFAAAPGKVVFAGVHAGYGLMVEIDHGQGIKTRYAHAQSFSVQAGDLVRAGQRIGAVGNSGRSTGSHLHFEVRINGIAQNPKRFLDESTAHLLARAS